MRWLVHKFGGSSLIDAAAYRHVAGILEREAGPRTAVVVSAMGGMTDALLRLIDLASERDAANRDELETLRRRQCGVAGELVEGDAGRELLQRIESDFEDIAELLRALWLMRSRPRRAVDLVSGYGELWSAQVFAAHLASIGKSVTWLDAREVLTLERGGTGPVVDWERTRRAFASWLEASDAATVVVPGFVATDADGLPTTLGRNGSDHSASIFASLVDAEAIHIWTDVDGVLTADPTEVPDAHPLAELSYDEAMELAYFGAKVIHPATMAPAVAAATPIFIRNTFRPEAPGTKIHAAGTAEGPVKGFATIPDMALVNLEGTGMIGVPGIAERLFGALRDAGVSVIMISQGSSEHSICFVIRAVDAERARETVEQAFYAERHHGQIQTLEVKRNCTVLAMVGENMAGTPGIAAKFFGALGIAGVNVRAIAQGSSERNISIVIDGTDATRALRAVHSGLYLSNQTLSVGVVGPGIVGATLLAQLEGQAGRLRSEQMIDLRVRGICIRERMLLDDRAIDLASWREALETSDVPTDLDVFADHLQTASVPHAVLIDCTASDEVAGRYGDWLERGIHIITPNKLANSGDLAVYERLRGASRSMKMHYLYETTVGAALPIVQTLRDLIQTGDEILRIEGVLSGTLSYLFNAFDGSKPFSEILAEARELGYTEPDPREDLSGMDVARKVVILAREMGLRLWLSDVDVESLVPEALEAGTADEFMQQADRLDKRMGRLLEETQVANEVLRFVGVVDRSGGSSVRLRRYPRTHAFARIRSTDNIVQFRTKRYGENPLVVQGPGAGPDVTAGGVFADLLRLASYLGATV